MKRVYLKEKYIIDTQTNDLSTKKGKWKKIY